MNTIKLKGRLRNIQYSHTINDVEYDRAEIVVLRDDNKEDILSLRFKKFSNLYQEDQEIELKGNIRSFSEKLEDGKNKVNIYVFTYFDLPDSTADGTDNNNEFEIDGRICKMDELRVTRNGKQNLHFILANNIISNDGKQKLNNYLPMVCWGHLAKEMSNLKVSDKIKIKGQLHSRTYKKDLGNGEIEIRTAHEGVVLDYEIIK